MDNFPIFRKHYEELTKGKKSVGNCVSYFEEKAKLIEELYDLYSERSKQLWDILAKRVNKISPVDFWMSTIESNPDAVLGGLFNEWLKQDFEPPKSAVKIQRHLKGLWIFYSIIKPTRIDIDTLFKIDLATIKLLTQTAILLPMIKSKIGQEKQVANAIKIQNEKGSRSSEEVLVAYKELGVELVKNGKTLSFMWDGTTYSENGFSIELKVLQGLDLSPKQILRHLKKLHKDGHI